MLPAQENDARRRTCQECGMLLDDAAEFHPHAFCVWKKAGQDPWELLLSLNRRLGIDTTHWPKRPPLVRDLPAFRERTRTRTNAP